MNHTLVNPPVDRDKEIHEVSDVFIHRVKETDEGVVVRGAKMVATGSALLELQLRLLPRQRADQEGGVRALLLRARWTHPESS